MMIKFDCIQRFFCLNRSRVCIFKTKIMDVNAYSCSTFDFFEIDKTESSGFIRFFINHNLNIFYAAKFMKEVYKRRMKHICGISHANNKPFRSRSFVYCDRPNTPRTALGIGFSRWTSFCGGGRRSPGGLRFDRWFDGERELFKIRKIFYRHHLSLLSLELLNVISMCGNELTIFWMRVTDLKVIVVEIGRYLVLVNTK